MPRQPERPEWDELLHWLHHFEKRVDAGFAGVHHRMDWHRDWIKEQQQKGEK